MTRAPAKPKVGRPTAYRAEYAEQAEKLCKLGAIDEELAEFFSVSKVTINAWKQQFPEFLNSLKAGKAQADANIAERLYQRAMGYSHPDTHFSAYDGAVTATSTVKHYPPDTTAAIFWLKNRRPDVWRDRTDVAVSVKKIAEELSDEELAHIAANGRDRIDSTPDGTQEPGSIH